MAFALGVQMPLLTKNVTSEEYINELLLRLLHSILFFRPEPHRLLCRAHESCRLDQLHEQKLLAFRRPE